MNTPTTPKLHWWGTLLYPAALVGLFLGLQVIAGVLGVAADQRAAIAAIPAVIALVLSLPWRLRSAWCVQSPWTCLGVIGTARGVIRSLLRGLLKALVLLSFVLVCLALAGDLIWQPRLSTGLVLNALILGLGVGFAEELLFRGWLLGELSLLLGRQRGMWIQAAIFSLVHTRFNLPPLLLAGLLGGLMLLGLALGLQRRADAGLIWGAVGLHGGLVAGWFLLTQGLISIAPEAPVWLTGPDNPIGGLESLLGLSLLLLARRPWWNTTSSSSAP
jgi:membrane protease YdiL (CAAX protease family)